MKPAQHFFFANLSMIVLIGAVTPERAFAMSKSPSDRLAQTRSETLPLPRDPDIAVREEYDRARAQNTPQAWELFIARHGSNGLAADARKELEKLRQKPAR